MRPDDPIEEKDWKCLCSIHDELLHSLCSRVNAEAAEIARRSAGNPHQRYLALYKHIRDSDKLVAVCFNDWRRSTLHLKISELRYHGLLLDTHVDHLSDRVRTWLAGIEDFGNV
jgi:hypothetical protein